jgi:hypothetical protein
MARPSKADRIDPRWEAGGMDADDVEQHLDTFDFPAYFAAVLRGEQKDPGAGMSLLFFCQVLARGQTPPPWLATFMLNGLRSVLEGMTWQEAFPLPGRGRFTAEELHTPADLRRFELASHVYCLVNDCPPMPSRLAIAHVAEHRSASVKLVEAAWLEQRRRLGISPTKTTNKHR